MYDSEKQAIDDLFVKLARAERDGGPRDARAEELIRRRLGDQPASPYYMAQVILVQEQALAAAQARIEEMERRAVQPAAAGGFLSGLFGGGQRPQPAASALWGRQQAGYGTQQPGYGAQPGYGRPGGGGFMAGAMQTAMGVAGGLVVGNLLMDAFGSDIAQTAEDTAGDLAADAGFDMGGEEL